MVCSLVLLTAFISHEFFIVPAHIERGEYTNKQRKLLSNSNLELVSLDLNPLGKSESLIIITLV